MTMHRRQRRKRRRLRRGNAIDLPQNFMQNTAQCRWQHGHQTEFEAICGQMERPRARRRSTWHCVAEMVCNTMNTHEAILRGRQGQKHIIRHVMKQFYEGAKGIDT